MEKKNNAHMFEKQYLLLALQSAFLLERVTSVRFTRNYCFRPRSYE